MKWYWRLTAIAVGVLLIGIVVNFGICVWLMPDTPWGLYTDISMTAYFIVASAIMAAFADFFITVGVKATW